MKSYSQVSEEIHRMIELIRADYHEELEGVTVGALFVFDDESTEPVLKHGGYPAAAMVRITGLRDRALAVPDAVIIIDQAYWRTLGRPEQEALIDHELQHLERLLDDKTGDPKYDALGRPKLAIRRHDRQYGWFDIIARRHGAASPEVRQAKSLLAETDQLYFEFGPRPAPPPASDRRRAAH